MATRRIRSIVIQAGSTGQVGDIDHTIPFNHANPKAGGLTVPWKLCGVCPLEASSGKTVRHQLNRGGNRDANRALHVILVVRLRRHQPTRDYLTRRLGQGKTKNEIMRCLKRYITREIFHALQPPRTTAQIVA